MFKKWTAFLSLFTSAGTLICCAIPALLVALGLGASLAGFVSAFPQIIWLSENKLLVFGSAGLLLLLGGWLQYRAKQISCSVDQLQSGEACQTARDWSFKIYLVSVLLYFVGVFFAFLAPLFL